MKIHINYRAGAGGDFLKVAIWLLLHPEIKIDWENANKWKPTPVNHVKPVSGIILNAEHNGIVYSLCGLLDDGSIKPATILSDEDVIIFGGSHGFKDISVDTMALLYSYSQNISVQEALTKISKAQIQNNYAEYVPDGICKHTVVGTHYSFNNEFYDIDELNKNVIGSSFDKIISILPEKPSESLLIKHLDIIKNFGSNYDQTINETYNDLKSIINVMQNDIKARHIANQRGYNILSFKKLHCSTALELVNILSDYVEGLTVSDAYLSFHKKYSELNNVKKLLEGNKLKICDDLVQEYVEEVDKWLL